jgi:hypothetical protein
VIGNLEQKGSSMSPGPWWRADVDDDQVDPLPPSITLSPDYSGELPLYADGGEVQWQRTRFSPELLDRLASWQQDFDAHYQWEKGWRSQEAKQRWADAANELAADVRAELGTKCDLVVDLWPLRP